MKTSMITLTHDPKLDDPALIYSLRSDAFIYWMLRVKERLIRLRD